MARFHQTVAKSHPAVLGVNVMDMAFPGLIRVLFVSREKWALLLRGFLCSAGGVILTALMTVGVLTLNGEEIGQGKTDENGAFSITIPKGVLSAKVTINAGMEHVAHEEIAREGAPEQSTATEPQANRRLSGYLVASHEPDFLRRVTSSEIKIGHPSYRGH
ncbi:energy-coupling factor ABC transporter permease [Dethiosulfovibrio peptidovorans]